MKQEFTKEEIEKQKALIGEFVIRFEDINDWIRFIIQHIILKDIEPVYELLSKNIETLLSDITAEPLRSKFDSLIVDNFNDYPELIKFNNLLSNKLQDLTTIRNSLVHGSYRLGWKNFQGEVSSNTLSLRHSRPTKRGFEKRSKIFLTTELSKLNHTLIQIAGCYNSIQVIIGFIKTGMENDSINELIQNLGQEINSIEKIKLSHIDILN